jgi:acyl-CoA thioester hydrolase
MEKEGLIMPVIDIKATYKTPALFDDSLTIYVFLSELPRVKIIFSYEIKNQKDEIVCTGETTLAFLNAKTRKPVRCPEEFGALFIT